MSVYDRWHKSRPRPGEPLCREHGKVPTTEHGIGERWQVRGRDDTGTQRKQNFAKKSDADAQDAKLKAQRDAGLSLNVADSRMKVTAYGAKYRADLLHRDSTAERMERVFRLHVDPLPLGRMAVGQVRPSHMRAWVKDRSQVLAPSTLAVGWAGLSSMFNAAVIDRVIGISPCAGVKLPEVAKHQHYIPTAEQVHMLAETIEPRFAGMIYAAAGCGFRWAEITGLELDAVDFLRREIDVSQQLVCLSGRKPYLGRPKSKDSARTVEMPKVTAAALARHIEQYPPAEVEIWDRTDPRKPVLRTARLLFTTARTNPIHRATWAHMWAPAARAAGIPRGTGIHCLRHYFATLLIHKGASPKRVQLALGHSTPMITLNTYAGEWPEADERTRTIVDSALGDVPRMCPARAVAR